MRELTALQARLHDDLARAQARVQAIGLLQETVTDMTVLGFAPVYSVSDEGFLSLTFDLGAALTCLPVQGDADVIVVEDWPDDAAGAPAAGIDAALAEVQAGPDDGGRAAAAVVAPDLPPVAPEPLPVADDPEGVASVAVTTAAAKTDYHARYAGLKTKADPLTDEDRTTILRMHRSGESSGAIAEALGRDPRGFYHQINAVVADATPIPVPAEVVPIAAVSLAPAVPVAEVAAVAPDRALHLPDASIFNPVDAPRPGRLSDAEARVDARLDRLGNKGKWSDPKDDLYLLEQLAKGLKLAHVAADLAIDVDVCKYRFEQLVPSKSAEEQGRVAHALRRRIAGAAGSVRGRAA